MSTTTVSNGAEPGSGRPLVDEPAVVVEPEDEDEVESDEQAAAAARTAAVAAPAMNSRRVSGDTGSPLDAAS